MVIYHSEVLSLEELLYALEFYKTMYGGGDSFQSIWESYL